MKVLMSCYACEPDKGSEPGVGWNWALQAARFAEVWVLTRANNRSAIEAELARDPVPNLHFVYHDLPRWARFWKRGSRGVHLYYYLWQLSAIPKIRHLHRTIGFDLGHHVTFVSFRFPSALALLGIPYIWGPVAGAERIPWRFYRELGLPGAIHEAAHQIHNRFARLDPLVRRTALNAAAILVVNEATQHALPGAVHQRCQIVSAIGINYEEVNGVACSQAADGLRLLFVGALVPRKGVQLALEAMARLDASRGPITLTVVGDGPERAKLQALASRLGIDDRVRFLGSLARSEVMQIYREHHVLVFPSLRDSGGFAVLEAMAAGLPVICLALGGPATLVTEDTGFRIPAHTPGQVVKDLVSAIAYLRDNPEVRRQMGEAARLRTRNVFCWEQKGDILRELYRELAALHEEPEDVHTDLTSSQC